MIEHQKFIDSFNPDTYNSTKTFSKLKKKLPTKINLLKSIKYKNKNYNSINLLNLYLKKYESTRGINIISFAKTLSKILITPYINKNFKIEVIKDRKIIYFNDIIYNNEDQFKKNKNNQIFKETILNNSNYKRYSLNKVKIGNYNILSAGEIDFVYDDKYINLLLVYKLTYKIILEKYINGLLTNIYKVLYGIINNDGNIRYYNSLLVSNIDSMLSLDINKGINFFNRVMQEINKSKKYKFILSYIAKENMFLIN